MASGALSPKASAAISALRIAMASRAIVLTRTADSRTPLMAVRRTEARL